MKAQIVVFCTPATGTPLLAMQLAHIDFLDEQIEALNAAIETSLQALSTADTKPRFRN